MTARPEDAHPARALLLVLTAGWVLAGCTSLPATESDDHAAHGDATAPTDDARTVEVAASAFAFEPDDIEIAAGEDVALVLTSTDLEHDFVIDGVDFHLAADPGDTVRGALRIDQPGTYAAYCSVAGHREAGMETTVTVTG